jgi:uncharacterized protein YlxW (UPF0749 family)
MLLPSADMSSTPDDGDQLRFALDPEPSPKPTAPPGASGLTGRGRLIGALRPHASRAQVVVAVLLVLVGFGLVLQVRTTNSTNDFAGARRGDLIELLDSLEAAAQRTQSQIDSLEETRASLESDTSRNQAALEAAREQLQVLGILAGTMPAHGPGVRIVIRAPNNAIGSSTLINALEELRDAGAEAIELNDSVRVVAQTALVDVDEGIAVDGVELQQPYVIEAIGSAHTLHDAVLFPGGLRDEVETFGGSVRVREARDVQIASLHRVEQPQYAQPAPPQGG